MSETSNNLPLQLSSFIGRQREVSEVSRLVSTARLVTLTGSGGCGKTRLALYVASGLLPSFADGVWLVEFAALGDPALVPQQVAAALAIREQAEPPLLTTLTNYLRDKQLLLVLDNCEHLIGACAQLADALLRACPNLHILATSREALNFAGEQRYRVPSLETGSAARLFIERARAVLPYFALDEKDMQVVAQICRRLDGIPLAIELAATRVNVLSVDQIAARLDDVFQLLTGGNRTALLRQQTLRAALDWSYDLLSEPERTLFRQLAAFVGGWTLEAAEAVCGDSATIHDALIPPTNVLDGLTQLLNKSLVQIEERKSQMRYRMLEPIRQYAHERLVKSDEHAHIRDNHLGEFQRIAESAAPKLTGPEQSHYLNRLESEHDNLRAALGWAVERAESYASLRLSAALEPFWLIRGYWSEGRYWLEQTLALSRRALGMVETASDHRNWHAKVLNAAGSLALNQSDYAVAKALLSESQSFSRALGNKQSIAASLLRLGTVARLQGESAEAQTLIEESLTLSRAMADKPGVAFALRNLGIVVRNLGEDAAARTLLEEGLALFQELGDKQGVAGSLQDLGIVARNQGDYPAARVLLEESLALSREGGNTSINSLALTWLGEVARIQGDYKAARALLEESVALSQASGYKYGLVWWLAAFAGLVQAERQPQRATRLLGALDALLARTGARPEPRERARFERTRAAARAQLDATTFQTESEAGRQMTLDQAIAFALQKPVEPEQLLQPSDAESIESGNPPAPVAAPFGVLTSREVEVLRLMAQGLTDVQIAETLIISRRTVGGHLRSIYGKLNVTNRTAAARYAAELKLR